MTSEETKLLEAVRALQEEQVELTQQLVRIKTVNPYSGDDSAHIETEGQQWMADRFRAMGALVRGVPVPDDVYVRGGMIGPRNRSWKDRDNVVAEWTIGNGDGPTILLNNHMDTVGTAGMAFDPFSAEIKDGKMFGRGTSDTKGNLTMGVMAVEALLGHAGGQGLNGKIIFEVVVDEECNGAGAGTLACCLAGVTGDICIVLDGVKGEIHNGCNGIATAQVIVKGQSGHSSQGVSINAIDKAIVVKQAIDRFGAEYNAKHPTCAFNVGIFRSGTLPAIVPGEAELQINLNYDQTDAEQAERDGLGFGGALYRQRFEQAMAAMGDEDDWFKQEPVQVSWIKDMYPSLTPGGDAYSQVVLDAVTEVQGSPATAAPLSAWFDGAHVIRHLGIPLLGVSAGTPGMPHSSVEHVVLEDLFTGAQQVALAVYRLLRMGEEKA